MNDNLQQKWIDTNSGKICYFTGQKFPGRPTVVFLHGLSSNHTTWTNIMEVLRANRYNCLAPDLRGHGHSDKTKRRKLYRLNVFSDDLHQIILQENVHDIILVGYSFGGQIAIDYAARNQNSYIKGLVLISTNTAPPLKHARLNFFTPMAYAILNLMSWLLIWQRRRDYRYYEHGKAVGYWDSVRDGLRTMPISVNFWMLAQVVKLNLENIIGKIKIPTVFVYGKNDFFITEREIAAVSKKIPKAEIIFSKHPGHFVGTNAQEEITNIILGFLSSLNYGSYDSPKLNSSL